MNYMCGNSLAGFFGYLENGVTVEIPGLVG